MSSKSREWRFYVEDMIEACRNIGEFTAGLDMAQFEESALVLHATINNFLILGEAAKQVPEEVRQQNPHIEWDRIAGLRDILIHNYFGMDIEALWQIAANRVPTLQQELQRILDTYED